MRKQLLTIISMACLSVSVFAQAAGMTNLTASHLESDLTGQPLTGKLCLTPVLKDHATAFSANGAAAVMPVQTCYAVANGVLNIEIPDTSEANPPIGYKAVIEQQNGLPLYSYSQLLFPSGSTWDLDSWAPTQTANITTPTVSFTSNAPSGDCGSAVALNYSGSISSGITLHSCVNHSWAQISGGGTIPAAAGDLSGMWPNITVAKVNGQVPGDIVTHNAADFDASGAASSAIATLPAAARSGSYADLTNQPTLGTAAAQNSNAFQPAGSYVAPSTGITPSVGGPLTSSTTGGLLNLQKIGALYIVGDSFTRGIGLNSYAQSFAGLLAKDTPAPVYNVAVGSTVTSQYMLQALNNFDPNPNFTTVTLLSGIENDGLGGGTGAALQHYNLTESALLGWLTIPMSNRTWISSCTHTGSVFPFSGSSSIYVPTFTWQTPLPALTAAMEPTTAGSTETCTINTPASVNKLGINYGVVTGSTTTFTATIDGVSVTDACSGTTTFSNGPCVAFQNGQLTGLYRQEYSVTPATSHTVVLTYGSTGTGNQALWQSIDWAIPNSPQNNVVMQLATNPAWNGFAVNNIAEQNMINQFRADGIPVSFVDTANGFSFNGQTYAVNGTTDVATTATATCSASNNAKHPNTCGSEHYRQAIQAAEYSAMAPDGSTGFVFSSPNLVNNAAMNDNAVSSGPLMTKEWAGGFTAAASMVLNNSNAFGTTHVTGSTTITSLTPWPLVLGNEYSDAYITLVFDTVGGGVGTGGNPYPFKQAFTAATAGTAATFMWDSTSQAWFLIGSGNASDASDASGAAAAAQAAAIAASAQKSANLSDLASLPTALANLLGQPAAGTYSIVCATSTSCAPVTASTGGSSGVGPVVGASRSVTGGTSVANTTFLTVPTTGSYLISGYAWMTTASTSTGTLKVNLTYSNGSGTIFVGSNAGNMNNLASPVAFSSVVHLVAGSTVSYSTTVAASPDGAPVYSVAATATYIGPF